MKRIVSLVGETVAGELLHLGVAHGNAIADLIEVYVKIRDAAGILKDGKKEVQLSELRCMATDCGEFKTPCRFHPVEKKSAKPDKE